MSLETKIDNLVSVIDKLVIAIESLNKTSAPQPVVTATVPPPAPVAAPVPQVMATSYQPRAVAMPPPPSFTAAPVVTGPVAPFNDPRGMIQYVTEAYRTMGPEKGAKIQNVISSLGVQNINDIQAEHYGALFAGVEALKNGA